jgi:hypothetical protein
VTAPHSKSEKGKPDHSTCENVLRDGMAALGVEINVSTLPPIVRGPYTTDPHICPHGTAFWIEPTGEQIARWVEDGVE